MPPRTGKQDMNKGEIAVTIRLNNFLKELKNDLRINLPPTHPLVKKYCLVHTTLSKLMNRSSNSIRKVCSTESVNNDEDSENKVCEGASTNKAKRGRKEIECDSFTIEAIRRIALDFYKDKKYPTASDIYKRYSENKYLQKIGFITFKKWLKKKCMFKYMKICRKPIYLERRDIVAQREFYLHQIDMYRKNNYTIFYTDETWACPDHAPNKAWLFHLNNDEVKKFQGIGCEKVLQDSNGFTGGFIVKGGAGRAIINHVGSEHGFVNGMEQIFESKKDSKDYHSSMNGQLYIEWFKKLCENIPEKSVVVMDQAPYHRLRVENTIMAKLSWLKGNIIQNLSLRNVPLPEGVTDFSKLTKVALINLSNQYPVQTKYLVEEIAENSGKDIHVLWLPVAHCELNPIELIWAFVKNYVAKHNDKGGVKNVVALCKEACSQVTPELWKNCCNHVLKYEEHFVDRDHIIDNFLYSGTSNGSLIISVTEDDVSTECETDSDDDNYISDDELCDPGTASGSSGICVNEDDVSTECETDSDNDNIDHFISDDGLLDI